MCEDETLLELFLCVENGIAPQPKFQAYESYQNTWSDSARIWLRHVKFEFWSFWHTKYLSMKQCSLFCFVLFFHAEIFQITALPALLVFLESSWWWWVRVHRLGLRLCGAIVCKLLINEFLFQQILNKIKTEFCVGIWGRSWCCWKALNRSNLIDFISQNFRPKVWKILIFEWILLLKITKKITKIGFGRKNQLNPQCVHT
jgi:hypothetical protein